MVVIGGRLVRIAPRLELHSRLSTLVQDSGLIPRSRQERSSFSNPSCNGL